jgi:hypothetical protein
MTRHLSKTFTLNRVHCLLLCDAGFHHKMARTVDKGDCMSYYTLLHCLNATAASCKLFWNGQKMVRAACCASPFYLLVFLPSMLTGMKLTAEQNMWSKNVYFIHAHHWVILIPVFMNSSQIRDSVLLHLDAASEIVFSTLPKNQCMTNFPQFSYVFLKVCCLFHFIAYFP